MADDFAGFDVKPGQSTALVKIVDDTPAPSGPVPPKPPVGWDKMSYSIAREARKKKHG